MVTYQNRATWITRLWKKHFAKFFAPDLITTPFALVDEMLDKLPIDWTNPALKFCDPCCGSGRFLMSLKYRLLAAGHTEKHIIENMLYGMDIDPVNTAGTVAVLGGSAYNHNIRTGNSLREKWAMKFDVVVGNPPWAHPNKSGRSEGPLDRIFYTLMRELAPIGGIIIRSNFLKEDGTFASTIRNDKSLFLFRDTTDDFEVESSSVAICYNDNIKTDTVQIVSPKGSFVAERKTVFSVRINKEEHQWLVEQQQLAAVSNLAERFYRPGSDQYVAGQLKDVGTIKVVKAAGDDNVSEPIIKYSNVQLNQPHVDKYRVIINAPGSKEGIGCRPKICQPGVYLSQSVIGFWVAPDEDPNKMLQLLLNPQTRATLALVKQGNYNAKDLFKFIPLDRAKIKN